MVGFDAVCGSMESEQAQVILFASDISPKTKKKAIGKNKANIPVCTVPSTMQEIAIITGKPVGILSVINEDLAKLCLTAVEKTLAMPQEEEII